MGPQAGCGEAAAPPSGKAAAAASALRSAGSGILPLRVAGPLVDLAMTVKYSSRFFSKKPFIYIRCYLALLSARLRACLSDSRLTKKKNNELEATKWLVQ